MIEFKKFSKIPRLSRECVITEKIDGTNGVIYINEEEGIFLVGSRKRWITPEDDNAGFAKWAIKNKEELLKLGNGTHYGEWWGQGIQRGYNMDKKVFSLFNTYRWFDDLVRPKCCRVVPVLFQGMFDTNFIANTLLRLKEYGSIASEGFMQPEGIVIYHTQGNLMFKKTIENDESPKSN